MRYFRFFFLNTLIYAVFIFVDFLLGFRIYSPLTAAIFISFLSDDFLFGCTWEERSKWKFLPEYNGRRGRKPPPS